jgi:membrane-bound metal-dependent hydrolase YbcI (DUF457 family)
MLTVTDRPFSLNLFMFALHLIGERIKINGCSPLEPSVFRYVFLCLFARATALLELLYHLYGFLPVPLIGTVTRFISTNYNGIGISSTVHYLLYPSLVISQVARCSRRLV